MNITEETKDVPATTAEASVTPGNAILLAVTGAVDLVNEYDKQGHRLTEVDHNDIQYQVAVLRRLVDEMHE